MTRITAVVCLLLFACSLAFGQTQQSGQTGFAGEYNAYSYAYGLNPAVAPLRICSTSSSTGSVTYTICNAAVHLANGKTIFPLATTTPVSFQDANAETATPSAVSNCSSDLGPNTCQITITVGSTHGQGATLGSGSFGLQEAINDANAGGGGLVAVDQAFVAAGGSSTTITSTATPADKAPIVDRRANPVQYYTKNGSKYAVNMQIASGAVLIGAAGGTATPLKFTNATSGSVTVQPTTGALGTPTVTLPVTTGDLPVVQSCGSTGAGNQTCTAAASNGLAKIYVGESTLSTNAATITFSPGYTSTTSFFCVANDITTRANPVQMIPASATTATITNTTGASDVVQWICVGN